MIYKKVRKMEEMFSIIGIGCWNFGGDWDSSDEKKSIEIAHAAIDAGINVFDIAPVYGWFNAERVLGKALKDGKREKVIIASKCGLTWGDDHVTKNDLSRENLLKEIDGSLSRLQTDYIDIYQLHWPDPSTPIEETAEVLKELKAAGKIKYVGLSNFAQDDVKKFMEIVDVNSQQGLYNMLERNTDSYHNIPLAYKTEKEMLKTVREEGQAFFPYSPLFQGLLAGRIKKDHDFSGTDVRKDNPKLAGKLFPKYYACYEELQKLADEAGRPINELAVNWLRQRPEVTTIIGGVSSVEQLHKNLRALDWDIDDDLMEKINEVIEPFKEI